MAENIPTKSREQGEGRIASEQKRGRSHVPEDPGELAHPSNPPKRARGRPRKNSNELLHPRKDPNAPKRPRGRPRKDANVVVPPVKHDADAPKRGRGRPRKDTQTTTSSPNAPKPSVTEFRQTCGSRRTSGGESEKLVDEDASHFQEFKGVSLNTPDADSTTSTRGAQQASWIAVHGFGAP